MGKVDQTEKPRREKEAKDLNPVTKGPIGTLLVAIFFLQSLLANCPRVSKIIAYWYAKRNIVFIMNAFTGVLSRLFSRLVIATVTVIAIIIVSQTINKIAFAVIVVVFVFFVLVLFLIQLIVPIALKIS
jgi:hypothetical protein